MGFTSVITSALTPTEQEPFLNAQFEVHEHLQLLGCDLWSGIASRATDSRSQHPRRYQPEGQFRLRRGRRRDCDSALEVDASAFDAFWRFDRTALEEALTAIASTRWMLATRHNVVGYAITGRSGEYGFLQRLAVDRNHRHQGVASALVLDALRWARRRGVREMLVNTQDSNTAALALYEKLGFVRKPEGLAVLRHRLDVPGGSS